MQCVNYIDIKPSIKTDHSLILLQLQPNQSTRRGPGFWKFNASLLKDEIYIDYIKEIINQLRDDYKTENNKGLKWDLIKSEIRQRTITYSKTQSRLKRDYEDYLKTQYNELAEKFEIENSSDLFDEIERTKLEIEEINKAKTKGVMVRAKAMELDAEKDASYFTKVEKKNYKLSHIQKLENDNGKTITDEKEILKEIKSFYEKLYSEDQTLGEDFDNYFLNDNIPKLNDELLELCENELTIDECTKMLYKMKNGKTPGSDGFTVEFYKIFWNSIKDLVFDSFIFAYDLGELSIDQKRGVIKLIPKKDKIITFLKNWRPISLLNIDYKLLTHVLAQRLQKVLPYIIHPDQNGYINGRFIGCNIRTIYDVIEYSQTEDMATLITFIDYEKAFDSIKWTFMHKTLDAFGFGPVFKKWITVLYKNVNSCVMNNGYASIFFELSKGIRQGCPLSALLFILTVEILAIEVRHNPNIHGIKTHNRDLKISLLADDTTIFIKDVTSLQIVLNIMHMFKQSSGLKMNQSKTNVMQVGQNTWCIKNFKLKDVKEAIYTLGTWFYKDPKTTVAENYELKYREFEKILQNWKFRYTTLYGRLMIVKTLALAQLNYVISCFEIEHSYVTKTQDAIYNFIWESKTPKIKNKVALQSVEKGGLKIPHVDSYVLANRAAWIKRLLDIRSSNLSYLQMFLPDITFDYFIKCNYNHEDLPVEIPTFYRQILYAWFVLKQAPSNAIDIRRESVFFNQHISIDDKYVSHPGLLAHGLYFINDIVLGNGNFLSYQELCARYGNSISAFQYMSMIDAIPCSWRRILKQQPVHGNICNIAENPHCKLGNKQVNVYKLTSKDVYWYLIAQKYVEPTCIKSWSDRLNINKDDKYWRGIFMIPSQCIKDFKVREFQHKILHRYYPCQSLICKWDTNNTDLCYLCGHEVATLLHTFYTCVLVRTFWTQVQEFLSQMLGKPYLLSDTEVILGHIPCIAKFESLNHCLIYAKYYIHNSRHNETRLSINRFKDFYYHILRIEKEHYTMTNRLDIYNNIFGKLYKTLYENEKRY